jgi:hypothetical protein
MIFFCVGFFCSTFVLNFVSLIFFPDVDDFSCGCFLFSCFFPFDILFLYILFSFENESSLHVYRNKMVHGNQWATSTEISVATRILQSNINIWLQGRDGQNNICFN